MKGLESYYQSVAEWNRKCGNKYLPEHEMEWWKQIEEQAKLVVEESKEGLDACSYENKEGILDSVVDVFVVWSYLASQLEKAGYDVPGAIEAVLANNDTKIFNSYTAAAETAEVLEEKKDERHYVETGYLNGVEFYTVRNSNMKICKPIGFKSVELTEFLPK